MTDDTYEEMPDATVSTGSVGQLGPMEVPTGHGDATVTCIQMPMLKAGHMLVGGERMVVSIFVMDDDVGAYVALPIDEARSFAASLLRSADAADAGYGMRKQ